MEGLYPDKSIRRSEECKTLLVENINRGKYDK